MRMVTIGHAVFTVTLIGLGIMGLITGAFTPVWLPAPRSTPAREILAYASALVCLLPGIGLLWRRSAAAAARVLFGTFLAWLLLVDLPACCCIPAWT